MSAISKLSKMSIEPINGKKYGKHKNDRESIYREICIYKDVNHTNMYTTTHTYCDMYEKPTIDATHGINTAYGKRTYADKPSRHMYITKYDNNV